MHSETTVETRKKAKIAAYLESLMQSRAFLLFAAIVLFMFVMSLVSRYFLTFSNIKGLLIDTSQDAIISIGMVGVLASGGLDLSVGSTLAFSGIVAGLALEAHLGTFAAVLLGLLTGLVVGAINGMFIGKLRFDPFITTLGTMIMFRGVLLVIAGGRPITDITSSYNTIGQLDVLGFQLPVFFFLGILVVALWLYRKVRLFRLMYYVGSNEEAALMSGINVTTVKMYAYVVVGLLAAFAGVIMSARMGMADPTVGGNTGLQVLAACVIGGSSLLGGRGTVLGAVLGAFLLQLIINSLNIVGMGIYWQEVFTGVVLLGAIALDRLRR